MGRKSHLASTVSLFLVSLFFLISASAWFILTIFSRSIEDNFEKIYRIQAQSVGEKIGSQFFERYGDVQAMATAAGLLLDEPIDKSHLEAQLVDLLNSYARLYRLYDLIMIVSPRGQVLAMNSEDIMGRIHTSSMFSSMDIEHADWFAKPMAHIFTEDATRDLHGSFFSLLASDSEVQKIYGDSSPRALFSALIQRQGKTLGVVVSHSRLDWLTQQVQEQYAKLVKLRMGSSSIRVVDSQGRALASYGAPMDFEKVAKSDEGISIEAPIESARFPASVDWRVQIFSPRSDVRQFIQYWKFYYILLASFFFIASAMVTIYFGKRFKDLARDYEKAIAIQNKLEDRVQERTHALEENIHELKEMQDRMVAQEKMAGLGVMATGLAHEIKNPLNIVINSAQFLKEYYLRGVKTKEELSEAREFAEMIVKHSERINALIKSILLSARTGSEQRVVVDVNQLVNECLEINLKTYQRQHHVNVQLQTSYSSAEVRANVDVEDLRRVILNILDNALFSLHKKWNESKAEKALLQVSIEKRDEKVVIIVADNGVGISEEEKRNIFTPFFTTKDPGQGTGLGLSLSADILKKYDGEIYFESEKNEYCRFYISLPVYVESRLSQAQP